MSTVRGARGVETAKTPMGDAVDTSTIEKGTLVLKKRKVTQGPMAVELAFDGGKATGSMILGNPLNAVLWLVEDLRKNRKELQPGDLISLGSVKAVPPQPGQTYTVKYSGLPGGPISVSVKIK